MSSSLTKARTPVGMHPRVGKTTHSRVRMPFLDGVSDHPGSHETPKWLTSKRRQDYVIGKRIAKVSFLGG